jgi:hypothetical protein
MSCNWCTGVFCKDDPIVRDAGSLFHFACHTVYLRYKGTPLGKLLGTHEDDGAGGDTKL